MRRTFRRQERHPTLVADAADARHRWDLSVAVAASPFEEPEDSRHVQFAARRLFESDAPT